MDRGTWKAAVQESAPFPERMNACHLNKLDKRYVLFMFFHSLHSLFSPSP